LDGPEGAGNSNKVPKGFKRLVPGGMVHLRYAYIIQFVEVKRDPEPNIELLCSMYSVTRAGVTPEGMSCVKAPEDSFGVF
jgi:hypothetical protein